MAHSPFPAFIKDGDGRYYYVNEPFQASVKKCADELVRRKDDELFTAEVAARLNEREGRVFAAGQPIHTTETALGSNDARSSWFVTRFPFKDSDGRRFLGGLIVDLDELKRLGEPTS
jgi:hypothetical protein